MSRKLILLCQGKGDSSLSQPSDLDTSLMRPLSDVGKRQAQRMGVWLAQQHLIPNEIVCAPTERAVVTAEKATKTMGLGVHNLRINHHLLNASVKEMVKELVVLPDRSELVLLVARKKDIQSLLGYLTGKKVKLQTSSIAVLSIDNKWTQLQRDCAQLDNVVHASDLPEDFPYPDVNGVERRIRPAYYYQQSSVIPYRFKHKKLQILLIFSSKKNHLVLPKGIHEPGLSAQDSAAKEAFDEAGVEGRVAEPALGMYEYEKWGGVCQVTVYAMEVLRVIAKKDWKESYRGREWCSVAQAMKKLKEPALASVIQQLSRSLSE